MWGFARVDGFTNWKSEGPFDQVGHAVAAPRSGLVEANSLSPDVTFGYAVLFPDCAFPWRSVDVISDVLLDVEDGAHQVRVAAVDVRLQAAAVRVLAHAVAGLCARSETRYSEQSRNEPGQRYLVDQRDVAANPRLQSRLHAIHRSE